MGFKVQARVYVLDFTGTAYEGLEIRARSIPMEEFAKLALLKDITPADMSDALTTLHRKFVDSVISWNFEDDDDQPIPVTVEAFASLEQKAPGITLDVVKAWMTAIAGVSDPLGEGSLSGKTSVEGSIPMEALSNHLAS